MNFIKMMLITLVVNNNFIGTYHCYVEKPLKSEIIKVCDF